MRSEYSKWFWAECDELNKDTSFAHRLAEKAWDYQQSKIDELNQELHLVLNNWNDLTNAIHARTNGTAVASARQLYEKVDELQKRVDAVKGLAQTLWEKSEERHQQGKVWESKTLGECADEILDELEQALKGGEE